MKRMKAIVAYFSSLKGSPKPNDTPEQVMAEFHRNWKVKNVEIDITTKDSEKVETVKGQIYVRKTPTK